MPESESPAVSSPDASPRETFFLPGETPRWILLALYNLIKVLYYFICLCNFVKQKPADVTSHLLLKIRLNLLCQCGS